LDAKTCLCGKKGDLAFKAKRQLASAFTSFGKDMPTFTDRLYGSDIVLQATPKMNSDSAGESCDLPPTQWLAIGYFHGNPKFPCFRSMTIESDTPNHLGHLTLRGTQTYISVFEGMKILVSEQVGSIDIACYTIWDSDRPLSSQQRDGSLIEIRRLDLDATLALKATRKERATDLRNQWNAELEGLSSPASSGAGDMLATILDHTIRITLEFRFMPPCIFFFYIYIYCLLYVLRDSADPPTAECRRNESSDIRNVSL
jgi:hypothetical protein